ncbi:MAG: M20/M25/M40 family metallo-hydrolase, partial [Thermoanaerobaculia bacterium]
PHETRDTVVGAAQVVLALQTLVSRRISPLEAAVVSVTSIHGGSAFNIIPDRVKLSGTCRSFDRYTAERLPGLVEAAATAAAATVGCAATTTYHRTNGALVNDAGEAERCARVARRLGLAVSDGCRTMGGEDFCEFLDRVPGSFAFVGSAPLDRPGGSAHHAPDFDFDERALDVAADLLAAVARDVLSDAGSDENAVADAREGVNAAEAAAASSLSRRVPS